MIELLYSLLTVLGISIIPFFLFASFQYSKIYFYSFQIIIWILLISINDYKKNFLWNEPEFQPIKNTPYPPIKNIIPEKNENDYLLSLTLEYANSRFSIIKTEIYTKECLENYFIPENEECPLTEIKVEYNISENYHGYKNISIGKGNIFFKNDSKEGKLYSAYHFSSLNDSNSTEFILLGVNGEPNSLTFNSSFDYKKVDSIKSLEEHKLIKPYKSFKNYISICDYICLFLLIFSITYYIMGNKNDSEWNYFKIIEYNLQFIIFILYLVRFILFEDVKQFFKQNYELYPIYSSFNKTEYFGDYFPKIISIQSFPLAISLSMIFYNILFLIIPNKWSWQSKNFPQNKFYFFNEENKKIFRLYILFLPFIIIYLICFIFDIINDNNIGTIYKNTIDNWTSNPIWSIEINNDSSNYNLGHIYTKEKPYYFNSWKNNFFKIEKYEAYNYLNIYPNTKYNGKICGKDSYGNKLYFPSDKECPINDIFIKYGNETENKKDEGYKVENLGNNLYLYYANNKTQGEILIDIKIGISSIPLQLNYEKSNDLCQYLCSKDFYKFLSKDCSKYYKFNTIPFYKEIDNWNLTSFINDTLQVSNNSYYGNISLYSLTYQGINSISINDRNNTKNYKFNMDNFISFSIFKNILSSFNLVYFAFFSFILIKDITDKMFHYYISILIIGLKFFHFITLISCFGTNIIYVQHFMNKINKDFEKHKNNYGWILLLIFLDILFLICYISVTFYLFMFKENSLFKWKWEEFNIFYLIDKLKDWFKSNCRFEILKNAIKNCLCCKKDDKEKEKIIQSDLNLNRECAICLDKETQVILSPCGHKCLCLDCYNRQKEALTECPICKKTIVSAVEKVYEI